MKQDEIDRCLVLVYQSRNNAMDVNYNLHCDRVDRLCLRPEAKAELVRVLRKLADDVDRKYPNREVLADELAASLQRSEGLLVQLAHARMLLLTSKCPDIRRAVEQDAYGIFAHD